MNIVIFLKLVFDIVLLFLSSIPLLILICFSKFVKLSMTSFHPIKAYIQIDSCYYATFGGLTAWVEEGRRGVFKVEEVMK